MKWKLFYIAALVALAACKPSPERLAQSVARSIEYTKLDGMEDCHHDTIRRDTLFHIAAMNADRIIIDSICVNTYSYPKHTLRMVQYEDSTGAKYITCIAIFPDGSFQSYKEYSQWYYTPSETITHAQRDTLTDVCGPYTYSACAWVQRRMFQNTSKSMIR